MPVERHCGRWSLRRTASAIPCRLAEILTWPVAIFNKLHEENSLTYCNISLTLAKNIALQQAAEAAKGSVLDAFALSPSGGLVSACSKISPRRLFALLDANLLAAIASLVGIAEIFNIRAPCRS